MLGITLGQKHHDIEYKHEETYTVVVCIVTIKYVEGGFRQAPRLACRYFRLAMDI